MELMKKIPFSFEDKTYEIRIYLGDNTINVVAFYRNYPVNGFRHHIKIAGRHDPEKVLNTAVLDEIVDISKDDIVKKRWDKVMSAVQ
ncbi:hypothetical protein LLG96_02340 [bacterium]|nr:hypothetical protein [bacterium]